MLPGGLYPWYSCWLKWKREFTYQTLSQTWFSSFFFRIRIATVIGQSVGFSVWSLDLLYKWDLVFAFIFRAEKGTSWHYLSDSEVNVFSKGWRLYYRKITHRILFSTLVKISRDLFYLLLYAKMLLWILKWLVNTSFSVHIAKHILQYFECVANDKALRLWNLLGNNIVYGRHMIAVNIKEFFLR